MFYQTSLDNHVISKGLAPGQGPPGLWVVTSQPPGQGRLVISSCFCFIQFCRFLAQQEEIALS